MGGAVCVRYAGVRRKREEVQIAQKLDPDFRRDDELGASFWRHEPIFASYEGRSEPLFPYSLPSYCY
jgi:hypothetical protein